MPSEISAKRMVSLLLCTGLLIPLFASAELLENTDFSKKSPKGFPLYWNCINGTRGNVSPGGMTIQNPKGKGAVMVQPFRPRPGKRIVFSVEVKPEADCKVRAYLECAFIVQGKRKGFNSGSAWTKAPAGKWLTLTGELAPLPREYTKCYLAVWNDNGTPMLVRNPHAEISLREEARPASDLGGIWDLRLHRYTPQGLELMGMKPAALLRNIPVTPGKKYELSYQAQVLKSQQRSDDGGFFRLRSTLFPDGITGKNGNADILHGQGSRIQKRSHVFTIPADLKIGKVTFAIRGGNPGVVRLSHFVLKEIPVHASDFWNVKLLRPFYRDAFFAGDDPAVIEGEAESEGAENLRITMQDEVFEFPVTGKITKFQVPFGLPEGKYKFHCDFLKNGKVEKSFTKDIIRYPKAANIVTVTPDRKIKINGKAFFPIFMKLRAGLTEESLYFAARAGINTTLMHISYEETMLHSLDLAQKYGIRIFIYPAPPFNAAGLPKFRETVKKRLTGRIINHPALLGYLMPDEPLLAGVPASVIQEEYRILKEHDPCHPCWLNAAPRNSVEDLKPYGAACDILSVDVYPVPYPNSHSGLADKYPTCCGKYALRMNEIGCGKKATAVYLQGFAWHECTSDPKAVKKPYPTRQESRFMAYDSLLNGGTGYWLWGVTYVQSKEFYRLLYAMTAELHRYSGLFAEGKQLQDLKTSNPDVRCAVMEWNKQKYYFLLNLTQKTQQAEVSIQGKIMDSDGGTLSDGKISLSPYEVMVVSTVSLPPPQHDLPARNETFERHGDPAYKHIDAQNKILKLPLYDGKASWIWFRNGQHGLTRCFAEKKFVVAKTGEKVTLLVSADDRFIVYLNGKKVAQNGGWDQMRSIDMTKLVCPGENRLTILGIDAGAAPCALIAELRVGARTICSDASWKVKEAFKDDPVPSSLDSEENAVIVAPFGKGAWGRNRVRIFPE